MKNVELIINPYKSKALINIKELPDLKIDRLEKYRIEPSFIWLDEVLEILGEAIHDKYRVRLTGCKIDNQIIQTSRKNQKLCNDVQYENFKINLSLKERLEVLYNLLTDKKISIRKIEKVLTIFVDSDRNLKNELIGYFNDNNDFIKDKLYTDVYYTDIYPFISLKVEISEFSKENFYKKSNNYRIIIGETSSNISDKYSELKTEENAFIVLARGNEKFFSGDYQSLIFTVEEQTFYNNILETVEYVWLNRELYEIKKMVRTLLQDSNKSYSEEEMIIVDSITSIDPIYRIDRKFEMKEGGEQKLDVNIYPKGVISPKIIFKSSDNSIARIDGNIIYALKPSRVTIDMMLEGENIVLDTMTINIKKKVSVEKILFELEKDSCMVGEKVKFKYIPYPQNAENLQTIKINVSDESILKLNDDRSVTAYQEGTCKLIVTAENINPNYYELKVKPIINTLIVNKDNIEMIQGESEIINIKFLPKNCINQGVYCNYKENNINKDITLVEKDDTITANFNFTKKGKYFIRIATKDEKVTKYVVVKVLDKNSFIRLYDKYIKSILENEVDYLKKKFFKKYK